MPLDYLLCYPQAETHSRFRLSCEKRLEDLVGVSLSDPRTIVCDNDLVQDALWLSPDAHSILGTTAKDFPTSSESFIKLVHPKDRELLQQHIEESVEYHTPINHEFRILKPEHEECWIRCQGKIEFNEAGLAVSHSGLFVDITERKQNEQMLRRWEKLATAARLSASMAHEINNPLAGVVNLIYLAKTAPEITASVSQLLIQAEHGLERVAHAARQTLGFYRESSAPERIDLADLIESVLELYSHRLVSHHISIERAFRECPPIQGVRGEIRQAAANVIANAIDAVTKGGVIVIGIQSVPGDKDSLHRLRSIGRPAPRRG